MPFHAAFKSVDSCKNSSLAYPLLPSQLMIDNSRVSEPRKLNITTSLKINNSLFRCFDNLTLNRKHLIALISCELVSILGIAIGTKFFINQSLATPLIEQTQSELAVNNVNYHDKFNRMSIGLQSQSDLDFTKSLDKKWQSVIKQILKNKTQSLKVEYATLVADDTPPLVILVQGNPDKSINNLLTQSWLLQTVLVLLALLLIAIWTFILRRSIIKQVINLQQATENLPQAIAVFVFKFSQMMKLVN